MRTIIYLAMEITMNLIDTVIGYFLTYEVAAKKQKRIIALINIVLMVFLSGIQFVLIANLS